MSQSSSQNDATDFVRNVNFTQGSSAPPPETVTASDLLLGAYDPTRLHPMSGLTDKLDYLMLDDDKVSDLPGSGTAIPSRGWSDDLCYGTGTMYLSGMSIYTCLFFVLLSSNLIVLLLITWSLLFHRSRHRRSLGPA